MKTFNDDELYQAIDEYLRDREKLIAESKSQVGQWKYANGQMFGLFPLHSEIDMRGDGMWRPAKRQWLAEKPESDGCAHGLDANGRVLIIESPLFTKLFMYNGNIVDEVRYRTGDSRSVIVARYILDGGRPAACYECHASPKQYTYETFKYGQDKCVSSETKTRYVGANGWEDATWIINCTYQYDAQGLLRAYRDAGVLSNGRQCVYVRAGEGVIAKQHRGRKPLAGYSMTIAVDEQDKTQVVYSNAYGIEMSIDSEWPVDIVLLAPPAFVKTITSDTDVASMENVAIGGNPINDRCDLRRVRKSGGKWVQLIASVPVTKQRVLDALRVKLRVLLEVQSAGEINSVLGPGERLNSESLVVAMKLGATPSPESAQSVAAAIREQLKKLNCEDARVVLVAEVQGDAVGSYVAQPDIDGILYHDESFAPYLSVLSAIVLEC